MVQFRPFTDDKYQPFTFEGTSGKLALLVHGFPGTPYEMRPLGKVFQKMGYTSKGLLLPGFGVDIEELDNYTLDDWIDHVIQEIENQSSGEEIVVVGYSFGAAVVIRAIAQTKRANLRAILIAPFWNIFASYNLGIRIIGPLIWPILRLISPEIRVFVNPDFSEDSDRKEMINAFGSTDLDDVEIQKRIKGITIPFTVLHRLYRIGRSAKKEVKHLPKPVLVVQGRLDKVVPPRSTRKLIKGEDGIEYIELEDCDHMIIEPSNKKVFRSILVRFLGD